MITVNFLSAVLLYAIVVVFIFIGVRVNAYRKIKTEVFQPELFNLSNQAADNLIKGKSFVLISSFIVRLLVLFAAIGLTVALVIISASGQGEGSSPLVLWGFLGLMGGFSLFFLVPLSAILDFFWITSKKLAYTEQFALKSRTNLTFHILNLILAGLVWGSGILYLAIFVFSAWTQPYNVSEF